MESLLNTVLIVFSTAAKIKPKLLLITEIIWGRTKGNVETKLYNYPDPIYNSACKTSLKENRGCTNAVVCSVERYIVFFLVILWISPTSH